MNQRRAHRPSGRSRAAAASGLALCLVAVLGASVALDHSHSSVVDAAQCAVCHWNQVRPAAGTAPPVLAAPPCFDPVGSEPGELPDREAPCPLPPARGPPSGS